MRRVIALVFASFLLGVAVTAGAAGTQSGIMGTVIKSPTRPVCEEGVPCSAPAAGVALVVTRNGGVVARVTTAHDGTFRVVLGPATYVVRTLRRLRFGGLQHRTVRVRTGQFAVVNLVVDTGIR